MNFKTKLKLTNIKYHRLIAWVGAIALLIFTLSGLTHPIMSWTSPKSKIFFPPKAIINAEQIMEIDDILIKNNIKKFIMAKIVPYEEGVILQVTEEEKSPRRYFDLKNQQELENYDEKYAIWLARYYTGLKDNIKEIKFQNHFDNSYPWVNRLLPIYKITFDHEDNYSAFIYTELGALASLSNNYKSNMQMIFKNLHTLSWLNNFENSRVILMILLLLSILTLTITGIFMIFLLKNRKMSLKRKLHRLISYIIFLPLLMFSISGFYHLLQYSYDENNRGLKMPKIISINKNDFGNQIKLPDSYQNKQFNAISLIQNPNGGLLYRFSVPYDKNSQKIDRMSRYKGIPNQKSAIYFDAKTGEKSSLSDKEIAINYANKYLGFDNDLIFQTKLITKFGPNYDFRNKRLPVWQINYDSPDGNRIFIDPASGILVDHITNKERYESYSFSFLHKWNFLTPFTGRFWRDILMVIILSLIIIMTILGIILLLKKGK
jgi:hypothetical protein